MKQANYLRKYSIVVLILLTSIFIAQPSFANDSIQTQMITMLKNNEQRITTLEQQIQYLQNNSSVQQMNQLQQTIATLQQNNNQLQNEISSLKQQYTNDKAQLQKSLDAAVDKIAKETTTAIQGAMKNNSTKLSSSKEHSEGNYYKYKVQEGATLRTIAKAYKVSVESIIKANKIKSERISTGQILLIPKSE